MVGHELGQGSPPTFQLCALVSAQMGDSLLQVPPF